MGKKREKHCFDSIPEEADIFHTSYLTYLNYAWSTHHGVVISPELIWFTIATEIAIAVCDKPDKYENLFTKTPGEKQALVVSQKPSDPDFLDAFV